MTSKEHSDRIRQLQNAVSWMADNGEEARFFSISYDLADKIATVCFLQLEDMVKTIPGAQVVVSRLKTGTDTYQFKATHAGICFYCLTKHGINSEGSYIVSDNLLKQERAA